ncbi:acetyl-coenzyme A synthetase N-terminal domain-containing protein, partial [Cupriavidus sp. TA19]|uniref:acetyl-coenzyme A synthetase N-terminal domain-containing protein n=1 Tax=Cupriavidus sp. TA19 TaxID=701108 RepID=UPI00398C005E
MHAQQAIRPARAPARPAAIPDLAAYQALCEEAERDYEGFWARHARELLHWNKP